MICIIFSRVIAMMFTISIVTILCLMILLAYISVEHSMPCMAHSMDGSRKLLVSTSCWKWLVSVIQDRDLRMAPFPQQTDKWSVLTRMAAHWKLPTPWVGLFFSLIMVAWLFRLLVFCWFGILSTRQRSPFIWSSADIPNHQRPFGSNWSVMCILSLWRTINLARVCYNS